MKILGKKVLLWVLVWVPVSSLSFAAKGALKIGKGQSFGTDGSPIHHGESESSRAVRPGKKNR